jgi:gentisate 1,2-dioxygenase
MSRGDLILTPSGLWHEHGHDGDEPVVWLDVLDVPVMYYLETSYHVDGPRQKAQGERAAYRHGGIVPTPFFERDRRDYPMLRYPWAQARAALETLAENEPQLDAVQVAYVNPESGTDAQNILGFYAMMLRPGQRLHLPVRSPAMVLHLIEGDAEVEVGAQRFSLRAADTCCAPGYTAVTLTNRSSDAPSFLFMADETPLHRKLGVYERRV